MLKRNLPEIITGIFLVLLIQEPIFAVQANNAPPVELELLGPTYTNHYQIAICGKSKLEIKWSYSYNGNEVTFLKLNKVKFQSQKIFTINNILKEFKGDTLAYIECSNNVAKVSFFEGQSAGTVHSKIARFDIIDNQVRLVRYRK